MQQSSDGRTVPHGTIFGFRQGCRSRGGCPHHQSPILLTCQEAATARRSDYRVAQMSANEPVPRKLSETPGERVRPPSSFRRRARDVLSEGSMRSSPQRVRSALSHGTVSGYLKGCRTDQQCSKGPDGLTCREARNLSRRARARTVGVRPKPAAVDAAPATRHIHRLQARGMTLREIARAAGLGHTTITNIARRTTTRIWPVTLARILAVRPQDPAEPQRAARFEADRVHT